MGVRNALARVKRAWVAADENRRDLERRIASYNTPTANRATWAELDRFLAEVQRTNGPRRPDQF